MAISYSKLFVGISLPALCTGLASLLLSISANAQTIRPTTQKELKVFDPTTGNSGNIGIRAAAGTLSYTLTLPATAPSANQVLTANAVTGGNVTLTWATPVSGTVTSVGTNTSTGITGGTITNAGTLAIDTFRIATRAWRQKGIDSVQSNLTSGLALKVNISDTASMLTPYLRKIDTTAMLSPYLRANVAAATYVPQSRTITINGTSQGLTADRTFSVGTVTSVATNIGTGITGGTFTNTGTIAADTLLLSTRAWRQKGIDSVAALANTKVSSVSGTTPISSSGGTSPTISISQASSSTNGFLTSSDWTTFNNKQNTISLTTNETSGAATLSGTTLNIPQYQAALTNPVTGTGTQNYLSKFATAGTLTNSLLFDNGTNVGIGTTNPGNFNGLTFTGQILDVNGTIQIRGLAANNVAALNMGGDTYRKAALFTSVGTSDPAFSIGVAASGSSSSVPERLRITSSGNVGIGTGTITPTARLQVMGVGTTSTTTALKVDDSNGSPLLVVRNDGAVNIGTSATSPVTRVEILGNSVIQSPNSGPISFDLRSGRSPTVGTGANHAMIGVFDSNNSSIGGISFTGGLAANKSRLNFFTANSSDISNSNNASMVLDQNGDVTIGNTKWLYGLNANAGSQPLIRSRGMGHYPATYPGIQIGQSGDHIALGIDPGTVSGATFDGTFVEIAMPNDIRFMQANSDTTNWIVDVLRMKNGNVGIGTASPALKLHISGTTGYPVTSGTNQIGIARFESISNSNVLDIGQGNSGAYGLWLQGTGRTDLSLTYPILLNPNGGNVGIGTTNPTSMVDGNNSAINSDYAFSPPGTMRPDPTGTHLAVRSSNKEAVLNLHGSQASDNGKISGVYFSRIGGQADAHINVASIQARLASSGTLAGGQLWFFTKPANTSVAANSPQMVLNAGGNVGIGTTTIGSRLQVNGGAAIGYSASQAAPTNGLQVSGTILQGDAGRIVSAKNANLPSGSSITLIINESINSGYIGTLYILNQSKDTDGRRTYAIYYVSDDDDGTTGTSELSGNSITRNGGVGCAISVNYSNGTKNLTITNTSGVATNMSAVFVGASTSF